MKDTYRDCEIYIDVDLWSGKGMWYQRWIYEGWYDRIGQLDVNEAVLESIETVEELLIAFKGRKLCNYMDQYSIDIDDAMEYFLSCYGDDFTPDENELWYPLPNGTGLCGEKVVSYLDAYKEDKDERDNFIHWLEEYINEEIYEIKITLNRSGEKDDVIFIKKYYEECEG